MSTLITKLALALLEGKDNKVKADLINKNVNAAINREIAILKAELLSKEAIQANAFEEYNKVLVNNGIYENFNHSSYIRGLFIAKNELTLATNNIIDIQERIKFLEEELERLNKS